MKISTEIPDASELTDWVPTCHLARDALEICAGHFQESRNGFVVIDGFLLEKRANVLSRCLEEDTVFNPVYGLYPGGHPRIVARGHRVSEVEWSGADDRSRMFRFSAMTGFRPNTMLNETVLTLAALRKVMLGSTFREYLAFITGFELGRTEFDAHCMVSGDFIKPHVDDRDGRSLAFLLYLSRGWDHTCGGRLRFEYEDGRTVTVDPLFNRLVLFDVAGSHTHSVQELSVEDKENRRLSLGAWYYKPQKTSTGELARFPEDGSGSDLMD